jgi:hypothetical protein
LFTHTVRCISEDVDLEHKIVMTFTLYLWSDDYSMNIGC